METAESTGARDINVPEKETAAVRRDGEPLTNAAKRRRQTESETDAEEPQTDAGERPPSLVREDEEEPPPLAEDPAGQQARLAATEEPLASIAAQPRMLRLPTASAETPTPAETDLVPARADQGSVEEQLVSAKARPADTARKRTPSAVTEDPGPVLPSE